MDIYEQAAQSYRNDCQEADRERAYTKREEQADWHFKPLTLPEVEIPERGLSDWFEDGLDEIFGEVINDRNKDHGLDSSF